MKAKVTISIDEGLLQDLDGRVEDGEYESRSAGVEAALLFLARGRTEADFDEQLSRLSPEHERERADRGLGDYVALVGRGG